MSIEATLLAQLVVAFLTYGLARHNRFDAIRASAVLSIIVLIIFTSFLGYR